jgi:hypothetical protein
MKKRTHELVASEDATLCVARKFVTPKAARSKRAGPRASKTWKDSASLPAQHWLAQRSCPPSWQRTIPCPSQRRSQLDASLQLSAQAPMQVTLQLDSR